MGPSQSLWKRAFSNEFGRPSRSVDCEQPNTNWKELYVQQWSWRNGTVSEKVIIHPVPLWRMCAWGNLVAVSGMKDIYVWNLQLCTEELEIEAHQGLVVALAMENSVLCSAGMDGWVKIWSLNNGECQFKFYNHEMSRISDLAVHESTLTVALDSMYNSSLQYWDLSSFSRMRSSQSLGYAFSKIVVSPDGLWILGVTIESSVVVVDPKENVLAATLLKSDEIIKSIDISLDFVAIPLMTNIHVFNVSTWTLCSKISDSHHVTCVKLFDKLLISGTGQGSITLWDAENGTCIREIVNTQTTPGCFFIADSGFLSGSRGVGGFLSVSLYQFCKQNL